MRKQRAMERIEGRRGGRGPERGREPKRGKRTIEGAERRRESRAP